MGNSNEANKLSDNNDTQSINVPQPKARTIPKKSQPSPTTTTQTIIESKQQTQYQLPSDLINRQQVRQCINKYNQKIQLQMKKQYVIDFFSMREKLLGSMQNVCKQSYPVAKGKVGKQLKQCMQSVQLLVSQQDERMQVEFGTKLFLLADKCLLKEQRVLANSSNKTTINKDNNIKVAKKQAKPVDPVDKCVDKLVKYRNLNMEMHILKLQLAREML